MNTDLFVAPEAGRLIKTADGAAAFVPSPLPPHLELSWRLLNSVARAQGAVGNLRGVGSTLPNPHLLIEPFARREAVLSSQIEGTQASVGDLLLFEIAPAEERGDVREVANYVAALEYGFSRLSELPLSLRFLREIHERLMRDVRGAGRAPGEFRRTQNWIGPAGSKIQEATYVPPPVGEMHQALDLFEKFLHDRSELPALVRLALAHYQFEAIHPFLDGNGRVGRLLITFLLHVERLLDQPLLYLSAYFERHREEYYRRLLAVSQRAEWTEWIEFFLSGVEEQANDAVERSNRLLALRNDYRRRVTSARSSALLNAAIDRLFETPAITIAQFASKFGVTYHAAKQNVDKLIAAGIVSVADGRARKKIFLAREIVALIEA